MKLENGTPVVVKNENEMIQVKNETETLQVKNENETLQVKNETETLQVKNESETGQVNPELSEQPGVAPTEPMNPMETATTNTNHPASSIHVNNLYELMIVD